MSVQKIDIEDPRVPGNTQLDVLNQFCQGLFEPSQRRLIPTLYAQATPAAQEAVQELLYTAWQANQEGIRAGEKAMSILSNPIYGIPLTEAIN